MRISTFLNRNPLLVRCFNHLKQSSVPYENAAIKTTFKFLNGSCLKWRPFTTLSSTSAFHPTQVYKLVMDNHSNLDVYTLLKYVQILQESNLSDHSLISVLSERFLSELELVTTAKQMSVFFNLLEPCSHLSDEFFVKVANFLYRTKVYPDFGFPRVWTSYFKFLGNNRIFHKNLHDELLDIYIQYLNLYLIDFSNLSSRSKARDSDELDSHVDRENPEEKRMKRKPPLNRRFQETMATIAWYLCILNSPREDLIDKILAVVDAYEVDHSIMVRIYWSMSLLNIRPERIKLSEVSHLLNQVLTGGSPKKLSHINQVYNTLKSLQLSTSQERTRKLEVVGQPTEQVDLDSLLNVCKEYLSKAEYGTKGKIISKSQKLASDFLVRMNIPHQLEILTDDLISVDIGIQLGDEKIALEVDGPTHFIRNVENMGKVVKTGPCLFKQRLLARRGWIFISIPPVHRRRDEGELNLKEVDDQYRSLLLNSNSAQLRRLLSNNVV